MKYSSLIYLCQVKRIFKYLSIIALLAVSAFILHQSVDVEYADYVKVEQRSHSYNNTSISFQLSYGIPYAEILETGLSRPAPFNLNEKFNKHWAFNQIANHLVTTKLKQYYGSAINFLIAYRKSDLIFPFHYFW